MDDTTARFWGDLVGRLTGPMTFRLILQPAMATLYGIRDGLKDSREGHPPYFWSIFTHPGDAGGLLRDGGKSVGRVVLLGAVMDFIYQLIVFRWVYPIELIVVVFLLAVVPYVLIRGPADRIARIWTRSGKIPTR